MHLATNYAMSPGIMLNNSLKELIGHLPVAAALKELEAALDRHANAVLVAPPGAGKTTAIPLALLEAGWLSGKRILLLAPRRLAARAAAYRMAALLAEPVGQTVGYRIRMERRVGPRTRIEVVTEGVLTRMLQSDPSLNGVGIVIFDEFHERSLEADLGLALCREVQGVFNETLRLLVMSATLDPAPVTTLLDHAPLIRCEGRSFQVETRYVPSLRTQPIERAVTDILLRSAAAEEGNILAFLPGASEIRRVARLITDAGLADHWDVAPLYGNLTRTRQDAAIAPPGAGRHKIVLSTSIAETSLTIEQIRVVVDCGLQRAPRFDPRTAMTRLVTLPVSRASADQRRGRAGRLGPGICYRLWSQAQHSTLAEHNRPEILNSDLAGLALELAQWGVASPDALGWLNPPPSAAYEQAKALLIDLGALDNKGKITGHGRRMGALPLHPRLAHMILAAQKEGSGAAACDVAAILSERDPLYFAGRQRDSDLHLRLEALQAFRVHKAFALADGVVDSGALRRILKVAAVLQQRLDLKTGKDRRPDAGRLLAWAYPDRIACRRPDNPGHYLMANGRGAYFDPPEPLAAHNFLVVAELDGDRRDARIFTAAAYDRDSLLAQFSHRVQWQDQVVWNDQKESAEALRRQTLGALTLSSEPLRAPDPQAVTAALIARIAHKSLDVLPWTRALRTWRARVMLLRRVGIGEEDWPDLSDEGLIATLEQWLAPRLKGMTRIKDLARLDLQGALCSHLTWRQQQLVDKLAPTHWTVPSGSRLPIDYSAEVPVLAVRLQEMFGAARTPAIADGRLPLQLHLLSPAGRPAQVTQDLAGFWQNSYPAVKKELRGRYPKHFWPDDPLSAQPTARVKPRKVQ
jgi:ATP-dependent helicase HrpB